MAGLSGIFGAAGGVVIATGQLTAYAPGDDGSTRTGTAKSYTVNNTGAYSGSTTIDVPAYAAATISFDDNGAGVYSILDSANLLAQFKTGDTIFVHNAATAANCGVFTVKTGNVAGTIVVNETTIVDEAAGAVVTICKRATHSNQTAYDNNVVISGAKREWMSYTSSGEKVGPTSVGTMPWYDTTYAYTVYSSANTIQCVSSSLMRIIGGAALTQFKVGYCYSFLGFATAMNNLTGGWECTVVAVNGADLDLTFKTYTYAYFTAEAAVGDSIKVVCNSIFAYCAACNAALVSGLADWMVSNVFDLLSLIDFEAPTSLPNATAFPSYPQYIEGSTTVPNNTSQALYVNSSAPSINVNSKTAATVVAHLKRGP